MSSNNFNKFKNLLATLEEKISEINIQSGASASIVATLEFQQQPQQ